MAVREYHPIIGHCRAGTSGNLDGPQMESGKNTFIPNRTHQQEETMKPRSLPIILAVLTIAATSLYTIPVSAQDTASAGSTFIASVTRDLDNLSRKYVGLAQAMDGKYDWRPGEGVRSVGEVFNLIVMENGMLSGLLAGQPMSMDDRPEPITDPAQLQEALAASYTTAKDAVAAMPESRLTETIQFFGRETTLQAALYMMLADQHEHLGQSIAYARTNNVTPPWSQQSE